MSEYKINKLLPASNLPTTFSKGNLHILQLSLLPVIKFIIIGCSSKQFVHNFLSICQKTKLAVTAVHTDKEIKLYDEFLKKNEKKKILIGLNTDKNTLNFVSFAT